MESRIDAENMSPDSLDETECLTSSDAKNTSSGYPEVFQGSYMLLIAAINNRESGYGGRSTISLFSWQSGHLQGN